MFRIKTNNIKHGQKKTFKPITYSLFSVPYAHGEFKTEIVFDRTSDRYLLVNVGWDNGQRVHGCIIHIDIIDGKIWIQRDGTEHGIALDLTEAGIPHNHIVLGFREPELRQYTGYAIA